MEGMVWGSFGRKGIVVQGKVVSGQQEKEELETQGLRNTDD